MKVGCETVPAGVCEFPVKVGCDTVPEGVIVALALRTIVVDALDGDVMLLEPDQPLVR